MARLHSSVRTPFFGDTRALRPGGVGRTAVLDRGPFAQLAGEMEIPPSTVSTDPVT